MTLRGADLTGLAYLAAIGVLLVVGYKVYRGGQAAAAAIGDTVHHVVQSVGDAASSVSSKIADALTTEPPSVANINSPTTPPPTIGQAPRVGSTFFPSGNFVGDLEDASGTYSSPYALARDRDAVNDNNAPGS